MLLSGIQRHKKCISIIVVFSVITLLTLAMTKYYSKNRYPEPEEYTEKMYSMLKETQHIGLGDVFAFDFDKAFIQDGAYTDEEYYVEKMSLKTNIDIPTLWSGVEGRILFIKDNVVIYDYIYPLYDEKSPDFDVGIWIYPYSRLFINEEGRISIE